MKKSSAVTLFLFILLCCCLSGCASLPKNEHMEQEAEQLITALNEDDADQIFESMYPDVVTRGEFDNSYETIREIWRKCDEHTLKLTSIHYNSNLNPGSSGKIYTCQAQYYIYTADASYTMNLNYRSDDKGKGIYGFHLTAGTTPVLISGGFTTFRTNSVLQWSVLFFCVLSYIFILVTVIGIFRKRPRLYGAWLAASFVFVCLQIKVAPNNFHLGGGIYLFVMSALKVYSGGIRNFVVAFPAGALVYWCMRKRLLMKKSSLPTQLQ